MSKGDQKNLTQPPSAADSLETQAGWLLAGQVVRRVAEANAASGGRATQWQLVGFPPDAIGDIVAGLAKLDRPPVVKVDAAYAGAAGVPKGMFLDPATEAMTAFRNLFDNAYVLVRRDANADESDSLAAVEKLDPRDVLADTDGLIEAAGGDLPGPEQQGLARLAKLLVDEASPTLMELLRFLLAVRAVRRDGLPLGESVGRSLPELGRFRDVATFAAVKFEKVAGDQPTQRRLIGAVREAVKNRFHETQCHSSRGVPLEAEQLHAALKAAVDDEAIPADAEPVLRRFIDDPASESARRAALDLDWQADGVSRLFKPPPKVRQGLGEQTKEFLGYDEGLPLDDHDVELLAQLNATKKQPSETIDEALREFYDEHQTSLKHNATLHEKWRKLLFRQDIEEDDFLLALHKVADDLVDAELDPGRFPLTLHVRPDAGVRSRIIEQFNGEAVAYFVTRYRNLAALFGGTLELDLGDFDWTLEQVRAAQESNKTEVPESKSDKLDGFRVGRLTRKANAFPFMASLADREGKDVLGAQRRFLWTFDANSFLAGLPDDLRRHAAHPLSRYELERSGTSTKGVRPPVALDEPGCVAADQDRGRGRLVTDKAHAGRVDVKQQVLHAMAELEAGDAITPAPGGSRGRG